MHLTTKIPTGAQTPDGHNLTDEEARAESARRVAAGQLPLLRMEAPSLGLNGVGDAFVCLSKGKLSMSTLSMVPERIGATAVPESEIASKVAQWSAGCVLFADRASLSAVLRGLERSGVPKDRMRARAIAYMCRLPLNGRYAVLTDALATRYIAPEPRPTLGTWRAALHVDGQRSTLEAAFELANIAASGEALVTPAMKMGSLATLAQTGKHIYEGLCYGESAAVRTFKAINTHVDIWAAIERTDAILRQNAMRSGDTVEATPITMLGGIVECAVTTPFKLRPGSEVIVWRDGTDWLPATLLDLGYDQATEGLTARFAPPQAGKRSRNGYELLFDKTGSGERTLVTSAPYVGGGGSRGASWSSGQIVTREVPLYVTLAAAASANRGG